MKKIRNLIALGMFSVFMSACTTMPATNDQATKTINVKSVEVEPAETKIETAILSTAYKPLVYGEEKPLICDKPFPQEGRLKNRPNLQIMWENYLYDRPEGIWGEIGGMVEVNGNLPLDQGRWTNACSVRLSHMLNKAGHKIPRGSDNKTVSGGNKDQYYYRLADLETYLKDSFGAPDLAINDGTANSFDLPVAPGIVLMDFPDASYTGHVTIWNGSGTVDGSNIGGYRVLFWSLPCFMPAERQSKDMAETKTQTSVERAF